MQPTTQTTSTRTIWTLLALLILAIIFWKWSLAYRANQAMKPVETADSGQYMADEDLDAELNSSMNSNSELELRAIDQEF